MSTKTLFGILLAGVTGVCIFLFVHLSGGTDGPGVTIGSKSATACTKGDRECLPDVSYTDTSGRTWTTAQLNNKVVVVNFWATWCHPCESEIPDFSKVYEKYKNQDVVFLGILTNDDPSDSELLNFQSDHAMTYPVIRGTSDIMSVYPFPKGLPTTYVFNRGGKQMFNRMGPVREDELVRLLDKLTAEKLADK